MSLTSTTVGSATVVQLPPASPPALNRFISVGAFYDRFGANKLAVLTSTNATVQALIKDASVRKYIDLDRADLPAGLAAIEAAGIDIDAGAILGDPILASERP